MSDKESYIVRAANEQDLGDLPDIEHAAAQLFLDSEYAEIAAEERSTVGEFRRWLDRDALCVAVTRSGVPAGFAIAYDMDRDAYLHEIDVHPRHSRRGVGRLMIEYLRDGAARRGQNRVVLSTFRDVPWNAPYYRRIGFRELAEGELAPHLREVRRRETEIDLKVDRRLFMALPVS